MCHIPCCACHLYSFYTVIKHFLLIRHTLRRASLKMAKRQDNLFCHRIKTYSNAAEYKTNKFNCKRQIKCPDMTPKCLWKSIEEPFQREQPVGFFPDLMNITISPCCQRLKIPKNFRL